MRVTIVQGPFLPVPPVQGGAVEKLWTRLGLEFAHAGLEVTHISKAYPGQAPREDDAGVKRIRLNGYERPARGWQAKLLDMAYSLRVMRHLPDADILITNTFFLPLLPIPSRKGRIYVSVHRFPKGQYCLYGRATRLQCVSSAVASELVRQLPAARARVRVISNFVEGVEKPKSTFLTDGASGPRRLLFVGRIHPEKGLELLIRACAHSHVAREGGWQLRVVGPHEQALGGGGYQYLVGLKQLALSLGLLVDWCPAEFDAERLGAHYRAADLFVYPSLARFGEAFGLAPLEAMAYGVPSVVSDLECFQEFLREGENGWRFSLQASDPVSALADTLDRACAEVTARAISLAAVSLETAQCFTPQAIAAQFIEDFHSLADA